MNDTLRLATVVVAALGGLATLGIALYAVDAVSAVSVAFIAWAIAPFLAIYAGARTPRPSIAAWAVRLVMAIAISVFGLWIYSLGFFAKPDPQSGLLFIFIPLWQWAGFIAAFVVAYALDRRAR